jgi:WD40 repeat protein
VAAALVGFFVALAVAGALATAVLGHSRLALAGGLVLGVGMVGVVLVVGLLLLGTWAARTKRAREAAAPAPARLTRPAAPRGAGGWKRRAALAGIFLWVLLAGLALALAFVVLSVRGCRVSITRPAVRSVARTEPEPNHGLWQPRREVTLKTRYSGVRAVTFAPDGNTLVAVSGTAADQPGGVELWDASTLAAWKATTLRPGPALKEPHGVRCAAFSPDGGLLATGELDNTVKLRDPATGAVRHTLKGHDKAVTAVVFTPDSKRLVTASLDGTVRLWDLDTRLVRRTFRGHEGGVLCAALSRDGRMLATGGMDKAVRRWDVDTGQELLYVPLPSRPEKNSEHRGPVECVAFSPDGRTLATGGWDGEVRLWDAQTGRGLATLIGHAARVCSVAFSPDGQTLASAGFGGEVRLWDAQTGRVQGGLRANELGDAYSVTFSPDGRALVAGGWRDRVFLWDLGRAAAR